MRTTMAIAALMTVLAGCGTPERLAGTGSTAPLPDPTGLRWQGIREASNETVDAFQNKSGVLLVFWATWCRPCKAEIPHVMEFTRLTAARRISVIGVSIDTERADLDAYVAKRPLPYSVMHDPTLLIAKRFGAENTPTIIGLDASGKEIFRSDRIPENPADLADRLEQGTSP